MMLLLTLMLFSLPKCSPLPLNFPRHFTSVIIYQAALAHTAPTQGHPAMPVSLQKSQGAMTA